MSWIDLAALTMTLWSAAKGYIYGGYKMFLHCLGLGAALAMAVYFQRPFSAYLNQEWQAETVFAEFFSKNSQLVLEAGTSQTTGVNLPPLAGQVMLRLMPEAQLLPAATGEGALALMATMLVKVLALFVFFVFIAAIITLLIRVKHFGTNWKNIPEHQRLVGVLLGALYGLMLSMVVCVALDALSMLGIFGFLHQDLTVSYLAWMVSYLLQFI
ncbi:CvpA family protein [Dethiobacter alkaliphilus]|uniref:Colicin V production protein n=1 Tax=Dethiobacter alkaliphilus AHT 1 TaxID=555088 RepID=C0GI88_DETAL|nr:CvpA family protein [Dethiobacter alkaliphilus]EEG76936.1 hypothetical protein DealDRAFT_2197 [Dethiobacter alkaliphilus AHT 1]